MVKKVGKYELFRTLGEGTFGKVKYAVNTETNEAVAIKVLDKEKIQKQNMGNQIKKEISIMKMVRHKFVVGMKEVLASRTKIFIVLELVTGGELFDKIVSEGKFSEEMARFYFRQLIEGVEYCHSLGVCHRDLKPENLLLDEHGNLKISDFGLSALYVGDPDGDVATRTELLHTTCGTPNYVAPEVLADRGYDGKKADVWSIGVILYVLLAGFLPFDEPTIVALFSKIQAADYTYPSWFTVPVRALLDKILVADPKVRVSLADLHNDAWVSFQDGDKAYRPLPPASKLPTDPKGGGDASDDDDDKPSSSAEKKKVASKKSEQKETKSGEERKVPVREVPRVPTEKEIEAGIPHAVKDAEGAEDSDGEDEANEQRELNAFDLVNQCGGFSLDRLFRPMADRSMKRTYRCTSNLPPAQLLQNISTALQESGFEVTMNKAKLKSKATLLTAKGMIGLTVQIYVLLSKPSTLSLVEIRRGKGDIMEFHNSFSDLQKKISTYVNLPANSLASSS